MEPRQLPSMPDPSLNLTMHIGTFHLTASLLLRYADSARVLTSCHRPHGGVHHRLPIAQLYLELPVLAQAWIALDLPQEALLGMLDNAQFLGGGADGVSGADAKCLLQCTNCDICCILWSSKSPHRGHAECSSWM